MKCIFFFTLFLFIGLSELQSQNPWQNPDGGEWEVIDSIEVEEFNLTYVRPSYRGIECIDSNNWVGLVTDNPDSPMIVLIRKTEDGGKTWYNIYTSIKKLKPIYNISCPDRMTILCGCDSGYILKSTDAGLSWSSKRLPEDAFSKKVKKLVMNGNIGLSMCNNGKIYLTEDCGENWKNLPIITDTVLKGVSYFSMPDSNNIFITGSEVIALPENIIWKYFSSNDRGKSWKYLSQSQNGNYDSFYSINFVTKDKGWGFASNKLQGSAGQNYSVPKFFYSENGGVNWAMQYSDADAIITNLNENTIFADSLHGIVLSPYHVWLTSDGGKYWEKHTTIFNNFIRTEHNIIGAFPTLDRPVYSSGSLLIRKRPQPVSVNESPVLANGFIFPNPAGDQIEIRLDDTYFGFRIEVYSFDGSMVIESEFAKKLDISNLSTGLYFIRIGNKFDKFIKL